jgi:hypothetical protein
MLVKMFRIARDLAAGLGAHLFPAAERSPPFDINDFAIGNPVTDYYQSLARLGAIVNEFVAGLRARLFSEEQYPANITPLVDIDGRNADNPGTDHQQDISLSDAIPTRPARTLRSMSVSTRTKITFQGNLFSSIFRSSDDNAWCLVKFDLPEQHRANLVLDISLPRDRNRKVNPLRLRVHRIRVTIPAAAISSINSPNSPNQIESDDDLRQTYARLFAITAEEMLDDAGVPFQLGMLNVTASMAYISGAALPALANSELQDDAVNFIRVIRAASAAPDTPVNLLCRPLSR